MSSFLVSKRIRTDDDHAGWLGNRAVVKTAAEFWDLQATFSSVARSRLPNTTPQVVAKLNNRFIDICRRVQTWGGSLVYLAAALFVAATRPALSSGA